LRPVLQSSDPTSNPSVHRTPTGHLFSEIPERLLCSDVVFLPHVSMPYCLTSRQMKPWLCPSVGRVAVSRALART